MNNIVFFPTSCLEKLDKLHVSYTVTEHNMLHGTFCTVSVANEDYDKVYQIGRDEHSRMLAAAYGRVLDN